AAFADALTWAPGFPAVGRIPPIISATFATIDGTITERDVRLSLAEIASGERARRHMVFGSDG
ncbi:MAG TPA: transketolase, partial [Sorangium sp.]|nr:transketolase [Sorangium sp.]